MCEGLCSGKKNCLISNPGSCNFLKIYRKQLDSVNYNNLVQRCERYLAWYKNRYKTELKNPIFIMIVYETPDNPCSERAAI